jgi:hypothetical protein
MCAEKPLSHLFITMFAMSLKLILDCIQRMKVFSIEASQKSGNVSSPDVKKSSLASRLN